MINTPIVNKTGKGRRNPDVWLLVFGIVLAGDLVAIAADQPQIRLVSKPLLILVLFRFFAASKIYASHQLYKLILGALLFSWAGDVLLLLENNDPKFFMYGLAAFLLAHVFYILFFARVRSLEKIRFNPLTLLAFAYYAALVIVLDPYLGDLRWPVRVYGLVITLMLITALQMPRITRRKAGVQMLAGALLFVVSDSLLAFNKFYHSFTASGILVMLTYGLAQVLIIRGAAVYLDRSRAAKLADAPGNPGAASVKRAGISQQFRHPE